MATEGSIAASGERAGAGSTGADPWAAAPVERPPPVATTDAPGWAREAVEHLRASARSAARADDRGILWTFPDATSALWTRPHRSRWQPVPTGLLGLAALLLLGAMVVSIDGAAPPWLWAVGALTGLVGAVTLPAATTHRRLTEGLLVTPDGLVRTEGDELRIAARGDVHGIVVTDRALHVAFGAPPRRWRIGRAGAGADGDAHLEAIAEQFRAWQRIGALPSPARRYRPIGSTAAWVAISLGLLVAVATPAGFLWLVAIMPATSGAGVAAQAFVRHLAGGDDDAAFRMLSAARRAALPREELRAHLTPELREARGLRVNGVAGGSRTTCVDGYLDGVDALRSQIAIDVVTEGGAERIDAWRRGPCQRRR